MTTRAVGCRGLGAFVLPEVIAHGPEAAQAVRHPGCAALTREGYCPKHKPQKAPRRSRRSITAGTACLSGRDDLRPAQLLREPFCRECAKRGDRIWATVVDHHQAAPGELAAVHRPGQPPEPVQVPSRPEDSARTGRGKAKKRRNFVTVFRREATPAHRRAGGHPGADARACAGRPGRVS